VHHEVENYGHIDASSLEWRQAVNFDELRIAYPLLNRQECRVEPLRMPDLKYGIFGFGERD
jgi:hypothetical protein